jgi:hypothetical protein
MADRPDVDAYIAGSLSGEELARFEELMIETPALAAEVDVRRRIKGGLELLEKRGQLGTMLREQPRQNFRFLAAAASILVAAIAFTWLYSNRSSDDALPQVQVGSLLSAIEGTAPAVGASFTLARTRSGELPVLRVAGVKQLSRIRILIGQEGGSLSISLNSAATSVANLPVSARVADDGFAEVILNSRNLKPGRYELVVTPATGDALHYPFVLEPPDGER